MQPNWWHIEQRDARDPLHCWKDLNLVVTDTPAEETLVINQIEYALEQWAKRMHPTGTMVVCVNKPINLSFPNVIIQSHEDYANNPGRKVFTERAIAFYTKEGDIVCDPFCGTSTTGACAIEMGRNYIGTDIAKGPIETSYEQLVRIMGKE
jgi:DNA methylase